MVNPEDDDDDWIDVTSFEGFLAGVMLIHQGKLPPYPRGECTMLAWVEQHNISESDIEQALSDYHNLPLDEDGTRATFFRTVLKDYDDS